MSKNKLNAIFQSIKGSLDQKPAQGQSEFLRMEPGNTYTVRLLPAKDPSKTFFHHFMHGWTSFSTNSYVQALSLQTFGERDPISERRYKYVKSGTDAEKAKAATLKRAEKWLVNVYVVSDPKNPENNGKNKIIRYGKQLETVITGAIKGDTDEEGKVDESSVLGTRVFDLSPDGVNLKIKVEKQGDFPNFTASKFTLPCAIADLTDAKIAKIYESVFELDKIIPVKSVDELNQMFDEHYEAKQTPRAETSKTEPVKSASVKTKTAQLPANEEDDEIKSLLDGIDVS